MKTLSHFTTSDNHLIPPQGYPPTHYEYQAYQELPPALLRNIYYPPHQLPRFNFSMDSMQHSGEVPTDYEADQKGPLVEPKKSCQALSTEYADADPVYVAKTTALARTHSYYRVMKGDGNCGWRAVVFGYFESLLQLRDTSKVMKELERIKSFNQLLDAIGQDETLYEIFVDATEDLFLQVSCAIENGNQDEIFLLDAFNAEYNSNAIITHFRLVTSAWMKLNPARYEAFLPVPLEQYCSTRIETVKTEIDGVGLQGLVDGIIEGAGFGVEICYLDRSEGEAVTPHLLTPERQSIATIRLLYRPGHYDIIYQAEPQILPQNQPVMQVNFQYSMGSDFVPWGSNSLNFDMDPVLMSVPRLSLDACAMNASMPPSMPPTPQHHAYPMYVSEDIHPPMVAQTPTPPISSVHSSLPVSPVPGMERSSELPIRMNPLVGEPMIALPLTTGPFRNSHYNQAHFQNPEFQPTMWDPTEEYK